MERSSKAGSPEAREETDRRTRELLTRLAVLPSASPAAVRIRAEVATLHLPLADFLASRFRGAGEPFDDLVQVARLGLVKAIAGYDAQRGPFTAYAVPTVLGELRRHFRDKTWSVKVPRRLQELRLEVAAATEELTRTLGRSPRVPDLAAHLGRTEEEVLEGIDASHVYRAASLDAPLRGGDEDARTLGDALGAPDRELGLVDDRESLRRLVQRLPAPQQLVLSMRFYGNQSQVEIAEVLGVSQMHVSRLLHKALGRLRAGLSAS